MGPGSGWVRLHPGEEALRDAAGFVGSSWSGVFRRAASDLPEALLARGHAGGLTEEQRHGWLCGHVGVRATIGWPSETQSEQAGLGDRWAGQVQERSEAPSIPLLAEPPDCHCHPGWRRQDWKLVWEEEGLVLGFAVCGAHRSQG